MLRCWGRIKLASCASCEVYCFFPECVWKRWLWFFLLICANSYLRRAPLWISLGALTPSDWMRERPRDFWTRWVSLFPPFSASFIISSPIFNCRTHAATRNCTNSPTHTHQWHTNTCHCGQCCTSASLTFPAFSRQVGACCRFYWIKIVKRDISFSLYGVFIAFM